MIIDKRNDNAPIVITLENWHEAAALAAIGREFLENNAGLHPTVQKALTDLTGGIEKLMSYHKTLFNQKSRELQ